MKRLINSSLKSSPTGNSPSLLFAACEKPAPKKRLIGPLELVLAPDGRRFGLWTSAPSVRFVQALLQSEGLRIQVPVEGAEPLTAVFELGGLAAAAAPLKEACAWE